MVTFSPFLSVMEVMNEVRIHFIPSLSAFWGLIFVSPNQKEFIFNLSMPSPQQEWMN